MQSPIQCNNSRAVISFVLYKNKEIALKTNIQKNFKAIAAGNSSFSKFVTPKKNTLMKWNISLWLQIFYLFFFFFNSIAVLPLIFAHSVFNQPKSSHQKCSIKKLILKISQYLQENIYVGASF